MRFSSVTPLLFLAATVLSVSAVNVNVRRQSPSTQLVQLFDVIVQDIAALGQTQASSNVSAAPDFSGAEAGLVRLSQSLDNATQAANFYTDFMNSQDAGKIASDLFEGVIIIKKVTEEIKQAKPFEDMYNYSGWITQILQGLEAQFDALHKAFSPHLLKDDMNAISAIFVTIICLMDDAANYLTPGAALTTPQYCNYYGTDSNSSYDKYQSCDVKPVPSLPRKCKGFSDCGNSASNYLQFGYINACTASMDACLSITWCITPYQPISPAVWTPPPPYCQGNKNKSSSHGHPKPSKHPKHPSHPTSHKSYSQ